LQEKTDQKLNEAAARMNKAERDFASKYNIKLIQEKSEFGDKMETASKLTDYTNKIFIIYFKIFKQFEYKFSHKINNSKMSLTYNEIQHLSQIEKRNFSDLRKNYYSIKKDKILDTMLLYHRFLDVAYLHQATAELITRWFQKNKEKPFISIKLFHRTRRCISFPLFS
jgi:flagellar biosynthesis regulator FlaF